MRKTPYNETGVLVGDHDLTQGKNNNLFLSLNTILRFVGDDTEDAKLYTVLRFIEHPDYCNETDKNDIGLVQTKLPMTWSRTVGPVCLPFYYSGADFSGVDVIANGWGTTEFGKKRK